MNHNNRGPLPLWQLALYVAVLGFVSMLLAPLTSLWWIVPLLGAGAPVAMAVIQGRAHRDVAADDAPPRIQVTRAQPPDALAPPESAGHPALGAGMEPEAGIAAGTPQFDGPESSLSEREMEVLSLLAAGRTNAEVASALFISVGTVKSHSANIYRKLEAKNRTEAVARARERGLLG